MFFHDGPADPQKRIIGEHGERQKNFVTDGAAGEVSRKRSDAAEFSGRRFEPHTDSDKESVGMDRELLDLETSRRIAEPAHPRDDAQIGEIGGLDAVGDVLGGLSNYRFDREREKSQRQHAAYRLDHL